MNFFKDGKYIIGFLVGVICSFVVMGGIKNYQGINEAKLSDTEITGESQVIGGNEGEDSNTVGDNQSVSAVANISQTAPVNSTVTKPEDPHSPELQRLALILRETEKMIERLKKDMMSEEIKQQTAAILNQN